MTTALNRKLKVIVFTLGTTQFQCQVATWKIVNNTKDGEKFWVYCVGGEFIEESDPDYALELRFYSDWRSGGVSDFLTLADETDVAFVLEHHPDIAAEHVQWAGNVHVKAPTVGGDVRTTEVTEVTLQIIGKPTYTRL